MIVERVETNRYAIEWLREFLGRGPTLSRLLLARLEAEFELTAAVPFGWVPGALDDFEQGGRGLERRQVVALARQTLDAHLKSNPLACAVVEDAWAEPEYPCGEAALPWILLGRPGHEELSWVTDKRWTNRGLDAALGAATGRRFVAILSCWEGEQPEPCRTFSEDEVAKVVSNARGLLTEIFDGESYLAGGFGPDPTRLQMPTHKADSP